MPRRRIAVLVGLVAVTVALAGCGGSSDDDGKESAATTSSSAAGGNERLSDDSWAVYTSTKTKAKSVNTAALQTFAKCRPLAERSASAAQIQKCLGDSVSSVVTEGKKVLGVLSGFKDEVAGACASALTKFEGDTKLYVASVNTLDSSLQGGGVGAGTGIGTQIDNSRTALAAARTSQLPFEAACRPA